MKFPALTDRCVCCGVPYYGLARYPFCDRCFSGRCRVCAARVRETILRPYNEPYNHPGRPRGAIGRPRGPLMPCGWGCSGEFTEHQMRAHFTTCPKRPVTSDGVAVQNKVLTKLKAKRGHPPGRRMPCGWGCGAHLTASEMRRHFTECRNRPAVRNLLRRHMSETPAP